MSGKGGKRSTSFQPGQSGNPNGRPPLPAWMRECKRKKESEFLELVAKFGSLSTKELKEIEADEELPAEHMMFVKWILAAFNSDAARKEWMNRLYGPVVEKHQHEGVTPFIIRKRDGEEIIMGVEPKKDNDDDGTK